MNDRFLDFLTADKPLVLANRAAHDAKKIKRGRGAVSAYWNADRSQPLPTASYNALARIVRTALTDASDDDARIIAFDFSNVVSEKHAVALTSLLRRHYEGKPWVNMYDLGLTSANKGQRTMKDLVEKRLAISEQEESGRRHIFYQATEQGRKLGQQCMCHARLTSSAED